MKLKISKNEMETTLQRSGYLIESRIIKNLVKNGYFVESNQKIIDIKTEKSREIDLVVEPHNYSSKIPKLLNEKISVLVRYVCEVKNNPNPVVLLSEMPFSPNIPTYESLREGRSGKFLDKFEVGFFDHLT